MCGGGGGGTPIIQAAPPPPPSPAAAADNASIKETQDKQRKAERNAAGRSSTILTSATGVNSMDETTKKKTLGSTSTLGG